MLVFFVGVNLNICLLKPCLSHQTEHAKCDHSRYDFMPQVSQSLTNTANIVAVWEAVALELRMKHEALFPLSHHSLFFNVAVNKFMKGIHEKAYHFKNP